MLEASRRRDKKRKLSLNGGRGQGLPFTAIGKLKSTLLGAKGGS
jgi:hypothetical protein